jgi:hypothetical protein
MYNLKTLYKKNEPHSIHTKITTWGQEIAGATTKTTYIPSAKLEEISYQK